MTNILKWILAYILSLLIIAGAIYVIVYHVEAAVVVGGLVAFVILVSVFAQVVREVL